MQQKIAEKEHKYFVLKLDDLRDLCELERVVAHELEHVISRYTAYRNFCKKDPDPKYIVCNQDEPYAGKVWETILNGENAKNGADNNDDENIDHLVDRFLSWPLPETVSCDPCACIPGSLHRVGTNLLTAYEARKMLEHVIGGGLPVPTRNIEEHPMFEAFIRAFWRRINSYKNKYDKELPEDMPVEFKASMATPWRNHMTPLEWAMSDDTGISSETIMCVMTGTKKGGHFPPDVPYDPSDFGRCYRLLKHFPEWRARLQEVADKYPKWQPLVDNWDKLTALYEKEIKNNSGRAPKLYEMMRRLREGLEK